MTEPKARFIVTFRLQLAATAEAVIEAADEAGAREQAERLIAETFTEGSLPDQVSLNREDADAEEMDVFDIEVMPGPHGMPEGAESAP